MYVTALGFQDAQGENCGCLYVIAREKFCLRGTDRKVGQEERMVVLGPVSD